MGKTDDRFEKVYKQGKMTVTEIWVDKVTEHTKKAKLLRVSLLFFPIRQIQLYSLLGIFRYLDLLMGVLS